jgi:L-amino acid N-acyltransferase YncA
MTQISEKSIIIRPAKISDIDGLCEVYFTLSQENKRLFHPFPYVKWKLKLIFLAMIVSRNLITVIKKTIPKLGFILIVAYDKDSKQLLGFIYCHITCKENNNKFVANVGITKKEGVNAKGIGTKLYALLIDSARVAGISKFTATILEDNIPSIELCKKYGYVVTGYAADDYWEGKRTKNLKVELELDKARLSDA